MQAIKNYSRLVKFEHTLFALPFALIGFFLGVTGSESKLSWKLFVLVILCMVFARNAAMGFNRFLDRKIDKLNPRTSKREIPSGVIKSKHALLFVIVNSLFFITTTRFINHLCFYLSPVALSVILFYSFTKRFTALCHFILSLGLAIAPVGAYLAVTGTFNWVPIYIGTIVFFWVSGFDIIYALQDEEFDKENKLKSIPSYVGKKKALRIAVILHTISAIVVILVGIVASVGWLYWAGAFVFISLLTYQHTLVKPDDLRKVNLAFFTTNGIASVIYGIFVISDLLIN
ncbi:MAG: 4-hydroxybenzoate octaprenyltransferase [Prolixibacteraceae bacterium]|nr:4-hydroxybenzoate octaprenyltransferase [Prolixibacteraceae bacterium]MBN2774613.1 4-hydroxybenzoate octaprenyltransferase [Prolixibacteraceae bacterium]